MSQAVAFDGFRKRDGRVVSFHREKIEQAVYRAAEAVFRREEIPFAETMPAHITDRVLEQLNNPRSEYHVQADEHGKRIPNIEDVQDLVEIVLAEEGLTHIVATFKRYRKYRDLARERIRVRDPHAKSDRKTDTTDASLLLVESASRDEALPWNRARIVKQLLEKTALAEEEAINVAKTVENQIIASGLKTVSTPLIREMVNNELAGRGFGAQLRDLSVYGVPRDLVETLIYSKSLENSNIVNNNPEAVNLGIAEMVLKQWALDTIFSPDLKRAHNTGAIHLHDLGYPHRVYCSSHSVEYVKKYGLTGLANLNNESRPAKSASVLTGHLNTFLASMQANYAGALGLAYINIMYAPLLAGMNHKQMKQVAQELIFNGAQNAFSRGGQTLFLDFNIHTGVPSYLRTVPAIGPGGHYYLRRSDGTPAALEEVIRDDVRDPNGNRLMELYVTDADGARRLVLRELPDKEHGMVYDREVEEALAARGEKIITYGDYEGEAREFARALLEVWGEGDRYGRVFEFPKCDFHVSDETFKDPAQYEIYMRACDLASRNGSTYFIFDRDEVTLSACCRLRTTIQDNRMLRHPESMRFCGFQNVTINIPQCAYRAARKGRKDFDGLLEEIDAMMELCVEAHLQKRAKIAEMMSGPGYPLHQIGKPACDGRPYVELEKATYIIGLIGVNDAVKYLTGRQLHEGEDAMRHGLRIVAHMFLKAKKLSAKHKMKFSLEESPAESAARRLAKADLVYYADEAKTVVRGDSDAFYYTNSVHLIPEAPVSLVRRIREQAKFHSMIESGAITHAFIGEERPSAEAIARMMRHTLEHTQSAQVTVSPEFTYCNDCRHNARGLPETCPQCGSKNVEGETRVVGYFSKIKNWNKSKRYGELVARQQGLYAVETAKNPGVEATVCPPSLKPEAAEAVTA